MSSVHRRHQLWVHTAKGSSGPICRACSWFLFPCRGVRPGSLGPVPSSRSGVFSRLSCWPWALDLPLPPHEDCAPASGPVQPSKGLSGARLAPEASILQPSPACRGKGRGGRLVQEGWHLFSAHRPQGVACEGKLQDQQVGASCCPPGPSGPHSGQGRPMASGQGRSHRMSFPEPGSVTESEPRGGES